jgi:homopolymeric O-antigen transport system ATP-binding protein
MSAIITVENLSKLYHIGTAKESERLETRHAGSLRDSFSRLIRNPGGLFKTNGHAATEELWALRDINFEVQEGEIVGIIGNNGAGKSTLLKILSRITSPTSGRIRLYGRVGSLLEIGTGFHPELTGRENIFLNGAILGMKKAEIKKKFDEIVAFSEIEKFIETAVKYYSSGMYMRLAFAVAAHLDPDILIIDEVLAVGDAQFQKKCLGKMDQVARQGRTVIFVSHSLNSVATLCSRVLHISAGSVVNEGAPASVIDNYLDRAAKRPAFIEWKRLEDAPGTDLMKLCSVRVLDEHGNNRGSFTMDEPVRIEITYWVLRSGQETNVGYHLYNSKGVLVFVAADFHDIEWHDVGKEPGRYRSVCEIPGKFLNKGEYVLDVALSKASPRAAEVLEKQVVSFELTDEGSSEVRGRFLGDWEIGVMRPKLEWKTARILDQA